MSRRKIGDREGLVELHVRLHAEGKLSLREIADMTGVHHETVRRDLARWHNQFLESLSQSPSHNEAICDSPQAECDTVGEVR
jgi:predicted DNA-binding transcriptional regulator YafY